MIRSALICTTALLLAACSGPDADDAVTDVPVPVVDTETAPVETTEADVTDTLDSAATAPGLLTMAFPVLNSSGIAIGDVTIRDLDTGGVMLTLNVSSIPEGDHAIHFHEAGRCDTPDFTSAGGHYNPSDANHGFEAEAPNPHAGDMPNFTAPLSGLVKTDILNERVSLSDREGYAPLFDADATALIIHAGADDYQTQPTGAAGGRIACAVIAP